MRVIIIEEKDALALLDQLKLENMENIPTHGLIRLMEEMGLNRSQIGALKQELHRVFHYRVVRWLQDQGADCTR